MTQGEYCVHFWAVQIKKNVGQSRQPTGMTEGLKNMVDKERLKELRLGNIDRAGGTKLGIT